MFGQNKLEIFHKEACEREVTVVVLECNSTIFFCDWHLTVGVIVIKEFTHGFYFAYF